MPSRRAAFVADRSSPVGVALTVTVRTPSVRVMVAGAATSRTVAT